MNYLISFIILIVWCYVVMVISWNSKISIGVNLFAGIATIILIGLVHWIPFWLIFMK